MAYNGSRLALSVSGIVHVWPSGNVLSDFDEPLDTGMTPLHSSTQETYSSTFPALQISCSGLVSLPTGSPRTPASRGPQFKSLDDPRKAPLFQLQGEKAAALDKGLSTPLLSLSAVLASLWGRVPVVVMLGCSPRSLRAFICAFQSCGSWVLFCFVLLSR